MTQLLADYTPLNNRLFLATSKFIEDETKTINKEVTVHAKATVENNLPNDHDLLDDYIGWISSRYQKLIENVKNRLLPDNKFQDASSTYHGISEDIEAVKKKHLARSTEYKLVNDNLETFKENNSIYPMQHKNRRLLIYYAALASEVVFNSAAFYGLGESVWVSICCGAAITASLVASTHFLMKWVRNADSNKGKQIRIALMVSLITGAFIGLGFLRHLFVSYQSEFEGLLGSLAIPIFVVLNLIIFLGILHFKSQLPTDEQEKAFVEHQQLRVKRDEAEQKLLESKDAVENFHANKRISIASNLEKVSFYNSCVSTISVSCKSSIDIWKKVVIQYKGSVPSCFGEPIPEIEIEHIATQH